MKGDPLSAPASRRPRVRPRRDTVRNRRRLLDATGEILRSAPREASMSVIAERAGLSTATVYRYFPSLEALLDDYLYEVIVQLRNYSHDCPRAGTALFEDVVGEWGRLVVLYGPAMVQLRSRAGFLRRLRDDDKVIATVRDAWERPVRAVMRARGIPDEHFDFALFLYNLTFDPREVLDLFDAGLDPQEALGRLTGAYYGALDGWAGVVPP